MRSVDALALGVCVNEEEVLQDSFAPPNPCSWGGRGKTNV